MEPAALPGLSRCGGIFQIAREKAETRVGPGVPNQQFAVRTRRHRPAGVIDEPDQDVRTFLAETTAADETRFVIGHDDRAGRSEEHTSELQSLMRTSYAVFCLKKKK